MKEFLSWWLGRRRSLSDRDDNLFAVLGAYVIFILSGVNCKLFCKIHCTVERIRGGLTFEQIGTLPMALEN